MRRSFDRGVDLGGELALRVVGSTLRVGSSGVREDVEGSCSWVDMLIERRVGVRRVCEKLK